MKPKVSSILQNNVVNADGELDVNKFLYSLNEFIHNQHLIMSNNITFADNFKSLTKEFTFTTLPTYTSGDFNQLKIATAKSFKATGVLLLQIYKKNDPTAVITSTISLSNWYQDQNNNIVINYITGLENSVSYYFRILII